MAEEKKTILLNGGREVNVTLVTKAHDFLVQLLGDAAAKSGMATLQVVKNSADKPFVAVMVGGKHVGFLSDSDAQDLFSTLADCEQNGVVAQAKGTVTASPDSTAKPTFRLSLAEPGQLLETPQMQIPAPPAEAPKVEPMPDQHCRGCGKGLPAEAKFCLECGTAVVAVSAPTEEAVVPTEAVIPVAPRVAPLPGPVAPGAQFSAAQTKGRGWWGRRSSLQKAGVIAGVLAILLIIGVVAGTAGGNGEKAVVRSPTTVSIATTSSLATTTTLSVTAVERDFAATTSVSTATEHAVLPNLVGLDLQFAQDTLQAAGWYYMTSHDATGQGRMQVLDRNWVVVEQIPSAGERVSYEQTIDFGVVKIGEPGSGILRETQGLPDVVGENLQYAIDTMQAAGYGVFDYIDVTGQGRTPIMHSNWVVLGQSPAPGTNPATDRAVTFQVKKVGE